MALTEASLVDDIVGGLVGCGEKSFLALLMNAQTGYDNKELEKSEQSYSYLATGCCCCDRLALAVGIARCLTPCLKDGLREGLDVLDPLAPDPY